MVNYLRRRESGLDILRLGNLGGPIISDIFCAYLSQVSGRVIRTYSQGQRDIYDVPLISCL